jgi:MFS transporter, DHA1 family, multidrug resistance protein
VFFFGIGITSPSATALALQPVPHIAGTASAAIGFFSVTAGVVAGYATTSIGGSSPRMFSLVMLVTGATAAVLAVTAAVLRRRGMRAEVAACSSSSCDLAAEPSSSRLTV